ncbi:MAG: hypothetical protein JZU65_16090, partial [Chlorobium sp.]|nr:hypothetical protein [Chlorobium sp.]
LSLKLPKLPIPSMRLDRQFCPATWASVTPHAGHPIFFRHARLKATLSANKGIIGRVANGDKT